MSWRPVGGEKYEQLVYVSSVSLVKHILEHFTLARHCACYSCRDFLNFYGFDRAFLKKDFFFYKGSNEHSWR